MKIDSLSTGRIEKPRRRPGQQAGNTADFSEVLDRGEPQGAAPAASTTTSSLDALLALQEVPADRVSRQAAERHGQALLDELDRLRHDLLNGAATPEALSRLAEMAAARKGQVDDPRLGAIIEEIELRAAVELAKFGR